MPLKMPKAQFRESPEDKCLTLGASIEMRAEKDGDIPSRFSGTAYTGGYVPGYEMVVDMSTTTYKDKLPLLVDHRRDKIAGLIESPSTENHQLMVAGRLFSDMPGSDAERIAQFSKRGMPFEMSIGIYDFTIEFVPAGKSASVNGKEFAGPVRVIRNGVVREVSVVVLGADPNTQSKFFSQEESVMDLAQLTARVAELEAQVSAQPAAIAAAKAEGAAAERDRIKSVRALSMPGHEALIEQFAADGKTTAAEAAVALIGAQKAGLSAIAAARAADAPAPVTQAAAQDDKPADKAEMTAAEVVASASAMAAKAQAMVASEKAAGRTLSFTAAVARVKAEATQGA